MLVPLSQECIVVVKRVRPDRFIQRNLTINASIMSGTFANKSYSPSLHHQSQKCWVSSSHLLSVHYIFKLVNHKTAEPQILQVVTEEESVYRNIDFIL